MWFSYPMHACHKSMNALWVKRGTNFVFKNIVQRHMQSSVLDHVCFFLCFKQMQGTKFYERNFAKFGRIFKTHLFLTPTVRIYGPDNIAKILQGENDIVVTKVSSMLVIHFETIKQKRKHIYRGGSRIHFGGGGGRKKLCASTHITSAEPNSLSAGFHAGPA